MHIAQRALQTHAIYAICIHTCAYPPHRRTQDPMLPAHMWAWRSRLTNPRARPVWLAWRLGPKERGEEQVFLAAEGHPKVKVAQLGPASRGAGQRSGPDAPAPPPLLPLNQGLQRTRLYSPDATRRSCSERAGRSSSS